ncbi:nuclease-related domain-containing protein [Bacillus ndiopicus]|uniref:nuclease-related domain-containing protein n=1 Tax=Bacillus ndiopicus TaxID=1347368 RepID=UPI0005A9DCB5|nr:nuclease-related domain-containing protein [Bacillus ndiopicus]
MLNRFVVDNLEFAEMKWKAMQAGDAGEAQLRILLENYQLTEHVLFNVSLQASGKFQIDCIVVTGGFVLVLESKNIAGELSFEENPTRLVRVRNGVVTTFESPEIQLERNMQLLRQWLTRHQISIPVIGAVVWTTSSYPLIMKSPKHLPMMFLSTVPTFFTQQQAHFPKILTKEDCSELTKLLVEENERCKFSRYPLFPRWQTKVLSIKQGVRCVCGSFAMQRNKSSWHCEVCGIYDKRAHIATLKEWFIFVKDTISNREACYLLGIESRHIAKRLLKSAGLIETGGGRSIVYKWPW